VLPEVLILLAQRAIRAALVPGYLAGQLDVGSLVVTTSLASPALLALSWKSSLSNERSKGAEDVGKVDAGTIFSSNSTSSSSSTTTTASWSL